MAGAFAWLVPCHGFAAADAAKSAAAMHDDPLRPASAVGGVGPRPPILGWLARWRLVGGPAVPLGLLLVALLALACPARAQGGLEIVQVGWDGKVVPATWSPLRVRVTGGATDANARVEVVLRVQALPASPGASAVEYPVAAYDQEVALPAGVTKDLTLWLPTESNMSGRVRLTAGDAVLAEETVRFESARAPAWPLVGVLAEAPAIARQVARIEPLYQSLPLPIDVVSLLATDLPPLAERLGALTALVVQGNAPASLTGEQRRAIQDWVAGGGHLLLLGGPDAPRAAAVLPPGALPVNFTGLDVNGDLRPLVAAIAPGNAALGSGPLARFRAERGAPLSGQADPALAWRLNLGQGTITLLAADPALEPLATWPGTPLMLQAALAPALPRPGEEDGLRYGRLLQRNEALRLQGLVGALPPEAYPGWQVVALLLGGFALLVGPVVHVALWRTDRRPWIWWLVPVAALLATGALFLAGIGVGRRDVIANAVSHVRLDPDYGQPRQVLAAGFFGPTHPRLSVTVPGDVPVRAGGGGQVDAYLPGGMPYVARAVPAPGYPGGRWTGPVTTAEGEPPYHVISGRETRVEFAGDQWSMRVVTLERGLDTAAGSIAGRLALDGELIRGTVRNDTPYLLEDAAVLVAQSFVRLGSLAPGQTATVVLDPADSATPYPQPFGIAQRLFARQPSGTGTATPATSTAAPYGYPPGMTPPDVPNDPETQRRVRLASTILDAKGRIDPRGGPQANGLPLTFIAFTTDRVSDAQPWVGEHPAYHLALLEQPLRLEFTPGPFTLPASLIPSRITNLETGSSPGGVTNGPGGRNWLQLRSGQVLFDFAPRLPANAAVDALVLTTRELSVPMAAYPGGTRSIPATPAPGSSQPGLAEAARYSLYNWQANTYDELPGGQTELRVEPAAQYVAPDGQVRLRITHTGYTDINVSPPELTIEGRVTE